MLINDILDLSKIESGTVAVDVTELRLADLHNYVERTFRHVAESKSLEFMVHLDPDLPRAMLTDAKRLQQVIKNLLSNAFKFTRQGHVTLAITRAEADSCPESLRNADAVLAFTVSDTGIGIPSDKQQIIFEAFQQADGSTSRKYGGTGLGLAISREIARLLGGEIQLTSAPGHGSVFTLFLPQRYPAQVPARRIAPVLTVTPAWPTVQQPEVQQRDEDIERVTVNEAGDDRDMIGPGDRTLLIVENDLAFAKLLVDVAHDAGFKTLVTSFGAAALSLARQYLPSAITLDISLPDIDGWRVLERLKSDFATRHIPVEVITTGEDLARCRALGALSVLAKPVRTREVLFEAIEALRQYVERPRKDLVLVHPDESAREELRSLLVSEGVNVVAVPGLSDAADSLRAGQVDCLIVGGAPDEGVLEVIGDGRNGGDSRAGGDGRDGIRREISLIVYGPEELKAHVEAILRACGSDVPVTLVTSPERLVDQCTLRLHQPAGTLLERQRQMLDALHHSSQALAGRKVLIVDDDIRNIFALTSILERQNMNIVSAETGRDAVELLEKHGDIEVVLMDVMMPEMDGFETTQAIRQKLHFAGLPIIAVTAKAMKGDREKCIEAGASDYLSKPVDPEVLVAKLRDWVAR